MQTIEWNESLSIGVPLIDGQHLEWVRRYNDVARAIEERHGVEKVSSTLAFLVGYTKEHFSEEESRMAQADYPDQDAHKERHASLLDTLGGLVQDFREDGPTEELAIAMDTFLANWLIKHIRDVDMKLGEFLTQQ